MRTGIPRDLCVALLVLFAAQRSDAEYHAFEGTINDIRYNGHSNPGATNRFQVKGIVETNRYWFLLTPIESEDNREYEVAWNGETLYSIHRQRTNNALGFSGETGVLERSPVPRMAPEYIQSLALALVPLDWRPAGIEGGSNVLFLGTAEIVPEQFNRYEFTRAPVSGRFSHLSAFTTNWVYHPLKKTYEVLPLAAPYTNGFLVWQFDSSDFDSNSKFPKAYTFKSTWMKPDESHPQVSSDLDICRDISGLLEYRPVEAPSPETMLPKIHFDPLRVEDYRQREYIDPFPDRGTIAGIVLEARGKTWNLDPRDIASKAAGIRAGNERKARYTRFSTNHILFGALFVFLFLTPLVLLRRGQTKK